MLPEWIFFGPVTVDPFSTTTKRIRVYCNGAFLSRATAFFYKYDRKTYLISNWHVFSGRNRYTGICSDVNRCEPTEFRFFPNYRKGTSIDLSLDVPLSISTIEGALDFKVPLKDSDGNNLWVQHKVHGQSVDIAAVEVPEIELNKTNWLAANTITDQIGQLSVGNQLFVVGFIDDINTENNSPIWKSAYVATEPLGKVDNSFCFLVDAKTHEGMSGSPVFRRNELIENKISYNGDERQITHTEFVGVYSGRHIARNVGKTVEDKSVEKYMQENHLDLGFVWPKYLVEEMLTDPATGSFELIKSSKAG
jgi:hypothetical protein